MKNFCTSLLIFLAINYQSQKANAQCNWQTIISDGFEYTTPIPDLIPGTCVHSVPQTFASHSGAYSMYMNFINCSGGTGTCAGALVYQRSFSVCENMPVRLSMWLTTTFNAPLCDMKMVLRDANGLLLDSTASFSTFSNPTWTQYTSATITSSTPTVTFYMYTNVDGGNGNDLGVDDLKFERCVSVSSTRAVSICTNLDSVNLYSTLTNTPVNTGTWTGPSVLTNGYWGTFTNGSNATGTYFYSSTPYGTAPGCPSRLDTVVAIPATNPSVNLPVDTTLCTNQFLSLNAGGAGITSYVWNTGAITSNIIASTGISNPGNITYSVIVTNQNGCTGTDTTNINFVICSGINEANQIALSLFPNPASDYIQLNFEKAIEGDYSFVLMDVQGKVVLKETISSQRVQFSVKDLQSGLYQYRLMDANVLKATGKLMIQR